MTDQTATTEAEQHSVVLASWLYKRAKSHSWQKRWCVLRRNQLAYYKDSKEYKASRVIRVEDILSSSEIPDTHNKWHFIVVTSYRVFHLRAMDQQSYDQWVRALEKVVRDNEDSVSVVRDPSKDVAADEDDDDDDDDDDDAEETEAFVPPQQIMDDAGLQQEFQNMHFSGTDDNFTSGGVSDSGSNTGFNPGSLGNQSTVSLSHFKDRSIPTAIPEDVEEEPREAQEPVQEQKTVYVNSFSSAVAEHVIGTGYLYRLKKRYNQWKKYYIKLTNHYMYFYKNSKDYENDRLYKSIDLDEVIDCVELDPLSRSRVYCMLIITPTKRVRFCADSEEELTKWLVLLKTVIKAHKAEKKEQEAAVECK